MTDPLLELEKAICLQQRFAIAHLRLTPQPEDEHLEELRQQYETVLTLLESEFLGALMSGDWSEFDQFVRSFQQQDEQEYGLVSADELQTPSADLLQPTEQTER